MVFVVRQPFPVWNNNVFIYVYCEKQYLDHLPSGLRTGGYFYIMGWLSSSESELVWHLAYTSKERPDNI